MPNCHRPGASEGGCLLLFVLASTHSMLVAMDCSKRLPPSLCVVEEPPQLLRIRQATWPVPVLQTDQCVGGVRLAVCASMHMLHLHCSSYLRAVLCERLVHIKQHRSTQKLLLEEGRTWSQEATSIRIGS